MSAISASAVKELRDKTGVSMMACKKALEEVAGDLNAAIELLRKRGEAVAQKRSSHAAKEGRILAGREGNVLALVEVNAETDFTARNDDFKAFTEGVLSTVLTAKPADLEALLATASPAFGGSTVGQASMDIVGKIGENISVKRFQIVEIGEGKTAETYIHGPGRIGVIVELSHEGASSEALSGLAKDLCMQVAAAMPAAVSSAEISEDVLAKEREIARDQIINEGKTKPDFVERQVEGRIKKFLKDAALVEQMFIKDGEKTVSQVVEETGKQAGVASLKVDSFLRFQLGEGA